MVRFVGSRVASGLVDWVLVPHPFIFWLVHMASGSLHGKGSADLGPSSPGQPQGRS